MDAQGQGEFEIILKNIFRNKFNRICVFLDSSKDDLQSTTVELSEMSVSLLY